MKLIVGLGNPGKSYINTRHNIGFKVLDNLASSLKVRFKRHIFVKAALVRKADLILAKPHTFMNLSGSAVKKIKKRFRLKPDDILIVCDDLNLSLGRIRLRKAGSSGGHNGLSSVIEALGTKDFARLRVGIGAPGASGDEASDFVLSKIPKKDMSKIDEAISRASDCCLSWVKTDIEKVMSKFNA